MLREWSDKVDSGRPPSAIERGAVFLILLVGHGMAVSTAVVVVRWVIG
jgi:hypothetical protein